MVATAKRFKPWEERCLVSLPSILAKSLDDNWRYTIYLRDGRIFQLAQSRMDGDDWLELQEAKSLTKLPVDLSLERRAVVRISEIVWCSEMDS